MPKREERELYSHAFDGNPFEDEAPEDVYKALRWDNEPDEIFEIDSSESLATIGDLAELKTEEEDFTFEEGPDAPYLALGTDSNYLYIIPKDVIEDNPSIPDFDPSSPEWEDRGLVSETHYYSDKGVDAGDEDAYYYHEHQNPLPNLWVHKSGIGILIPAENEGEPSYAVAKEGIIG